MSKRTGLFGTKIGNSSFYDDSGKSLPVTILKIDECIVSDVKTIEVAQMVCAMAGPVFAKTTGAQIPIDGGNERVI